MNYCGRFIPNFSTVAAPLRQLTHKGTPFTWTKLHQNAFESFKNILTSNSVMAHFDPRAPIQLRVDASPVSLCKSLSHTRRKALYYSQTEREALAVVKNFISTCMGQLSTSTQITSLLKPFTVPHQNPQHVLNDGAFACNHINFV